LKVFDEGEWKVCMYGIIKKLDNSWKKESGYHQRSLTEITMYRFKKTFSGRLQHRKFENQQTEALIKVNILNNFARIGFGGTR